MGHERSVEVDREIAGSVAPQIPTRALWSSVFGPTLVGTLAGLAVVPLQGYAWVGQAAGLAASTAAMVGLWQLVRSPRWRVAAALVAAILGFMPVLLARAHVRWLPSCGITLALGGCLVAIAGIGATRRHGARAWSIIIATLGFVAAAGLIGEMLDYWMATSQSPGRRASELARVVTLSGFLFWAPASFAGLPLVASGLGGYWLRGRPWFARLVGRVAAVALAVAVFRLTLEGLYGGDRSLEPYVFVTLGQSYWWWAPTLAAVFGFEARALRPQPKALRTLTITAFALVCLAVLADRSDPIFAFCQRHVQWAQTPTKELRAVLRYEYPCWRPDCRGDDLFGDWTILRGRAWDELKRRGEPLLERQNPWN